MSATPASANKAVGGMGEVFLSYHSPDRQTLLTIRDLLGARGVATFLDRENLVPGMPWPQALEEALGQAKAVVVCLGAHGIGLWQKREIGFALDRQVRGEETGVPFPVIPVLLPGADPAPGFLFLNTWIDLRRDVAEPEMIDALARAIRGDAPEGADPALALCPYRGSRAFREEDQGFFFGREAYIARLLEATLSQRLVALVGLSGSGKSSLVHGGLVPLLRRQHPPSATWDVVSFIPAARPFHQLSAALIGMLEPDLSETDRMAEAYKLGDRLAGGEVPLEAVIARMLTKSGGTDRMLLVVDQFEELFYKSSDNDRKALISMLLNASERAPVTVLVTLRAAFYDHTIASSRELSDILQRGVVNLGPMTREELQRVIAEPARRVAIGFEHGLVERILTDVGAEPGNLSLLEFALTELWSKRLDRLLTHSAYEAIGTVKGAIAQRAEELFKALNSDEQVMARRVFTRLWTPSGPDGAPDTRQRAIVGELGREYWPIIKTLADARLLVTGRDGASGKDTVEVAHGGLIHEWARFKAWLDEDREFLLWRQKLRAELVDWQQSGSDEAGVLRARQLDEARRWRGQRAEELTPIECDYIARSEILRERELVGRVGMQRRLIIAAVFSSIVFLIVAGFAAFAWHRVDEERKVLQSRDEASEAIDQLQIDPERSLQLAVRALDTAYTPQAEDALRQALLQSRVRAVLRGHTNIINSVAISRDGKTLATASKDHTGRLWDAATGAQLHELRGHAASVVSVAFDPDGARVVTAGKEGIARVWDVATGKMLRELRGHADELKSAAWDRGGKRILTASRDGTARLWDVETGEPVAAPLKHAGFVNVALFSPDGRTIATAGSDGSVRLWNAATGKLGSELAGSGAEVTALAFSSDGASLAVGASDGLAKLSATGGHNYVPAFRVRSPAVDEIAFSPDGKYIAAASRDNTARIWDAAAGKLTQELRGHADSVTSVAYSPTGRFLATAGHDGRCRVWETATGRAVSELRGHTDAVVSVLFSSDERSVVSISNDRTARVWEGVTQQDLIALHGHTGAVGSVAFSPDGDRVLSAGADNSARIWDVKTRRTVFELGGHADTVETARYSEDGKLAVTASRDATARVWDASSGRQIATLKGHSDALRDARFSPDGTRVVTASNDATARVWDARSGRLLRQLAGHAERVYTAEFSPDGGAIATASADDTARIWDTSSGRLLVELRGHKDNVRSTGFNADGKMIATASDDGTARVWETASGKPIVELSGHTAPVRSVGFSRDGRLLLTSSWDRTAGIWDAKSGRRLHVLDRHTAQLSAAQFTPDGRYAVTAGWDLTVRIWESATGKYVRELWGHHDRVLGIAVRRDGILLATAGRDETVRLWTVAPGTGLATEAAGDAFACEACGSLAEVLAFARKRKTMTPPAQQ